MNRFKIIAFTHKTTSLEEIGKFYIEESQLKERLHHLKFQLGLEELMCLSTCNRIEFLFSTTRKIDNSFLEGFFKAFSPDWSEDNIKRVIEHAVIFEGENALRHLFNVASSLDSLVVGEREIITQVRNAYERSAQFGLTGDLIRLIVERTIQTAKQVYTDTNIAKNPVSVVSLAYRKLKEMNGFLNTRFLIIGAGQTNTTMARYLKKHGYNDFTIFSRTLANAEKLAKELNGKAFELSRLPDYKKGFDVIVSCTGASKHIVTKEIYTRILDGDTSKKIAIDLGIPNDIDSTIADDNHVTLVTIDNLRSMAEQNLKERQKELKSCEDIVEHNIEDFKQVFKEREVELAMKEIPKKVKEIKEKAINEVFSKEIDSLDEQSKKVLDKVLAYVEKKYISVPIKMAKEVLLKA